MNQMIATVINAAKWLTLGVIVFGEKVKVWDMVNISPPGAYTWSQENKVVSCMSVFFVSNMLENALTQTGAFEVELNGMPIWSKLKSGRVPQAQELFEIINNQMQLSGDTKTNYQMPPGSSQFDPDSMPEQMQTIEEKEEYENEDPELSDFKVFDGDSERNEL